MENKLNVYCATQERLKTIFEKFDYVYVSFSGGKDSGVLLNLSMDFIRKNYPGRRLGVFHIDYEAQYEMTTDYVDDVFKNNSDILDYYRICLPVAAQCCTSMHQSYWTPWDAEKKDLWVRPMPDNCINESNQKFPFFHKNISDYEFQNLFSGWIHKEKKSKSTACLVGIRTQESFNRWRAIHSDRNYRNFEGLDWTKKMQNNVFNAYPIFDWKTEDVWIANSKFGFKYNRLYDLFYQAGITIDKMRVASPFNDSAAESLKLYKVIDPKNWGKMIGRVNGVNFTGLYGGTTAMGWREIKLPKGHTWKSYMEFLLGTLPKETSENYKKKLEISRKFWIEKGGCLSGATVKKLKKIGIKYRMGKLTNYDTRKKPIMMEYVDDIDISEFREIPSFKRMCICIMKNDHLCKYMGFSLTKLETKQRSEAMEKYSNLGKGEENEKSCL